MSFSDTLAKAVLSTSSDAIIAADTEGIIRFAAARALGLAGLDTDVKGLFADWRAQFPRLQSFADECARRGAPTAVAIPAQSAELDCGCSFPTSSCRNGTSR